MPEAAPGPVPGWSALTQFVADVTTAARFFDSLTDSQLDAMPPLARQGIAGVFRALADYSDGSSRI